MESELVALKKQKEEKELHKNWGNLNYRKKEKGYGWRQSSNRENMFEK